MTIDWNEISSSPFLTADFIRRFHKELNPTLVSRHQKLSEDEIRSLADWVDWNEITRHQDFKSVEFIKYFDGCLDWEWLSAHRDMSEEFMSEFAHCIDWSIASAHQIMSDGFVLANIDMVNIEKVLANQTLKRSTIEKLLQYQRQNESKQDEEWKVGRRKMDIIQRRAFIFKENYQRTLMDFFLTKTAALFDVVEVADEMTDHFRRMAFSLKKDDPIIYLSNEEAEVVCRVIDDVVATLNSFMRIEDIEEFKGDIEEILNTLEQYKEK